MAIDDTNTNDTMVTEIIKPDEPLEMGVTQPSEMTDESKGHYPSAELLQGACYDDYCRALDTYDKIYDKVNVALAFSGIVLLVIMSNFDYTIIGRIVNCTAELDLILLIIIAIFSLVSAVLIVWAVIQLLLLMRSKTLMVLDSIAIRNDELYRESVDVSALWLINSYTHAVNAIRPVIKEKQKSFDKAILKIIIAILCYAIVLIAGKGI